MCGGMRKQWASDSRQPRDFFSLTSLDLSLVKCTQGGFYKLAKIKKQTLDNLARTHTHAHAPTRARFLDHS